VSRSFREAPVVADEIVAALKEGVSSHQVAARVWNTLWPQVSIAILLHRLLSGDTPLVASALPLGAHPIIPS
jgi:hypothetical protein